MSTKLNKRHAKAQHTSVSLVQETLSHAGNPLDSATRAFMESRFNRSFDSVRVHHGELAGKSTRSMQSNAYSFGSQIVFSQGQYAPGTPAGKMLLAHELAHVCQSNLPANAVPAGIGEPHSMEEQQAHGAAARLLHSDSLPEFSVSNVPLIRRNGGPRMTGISPGSTTTTESTLENEVSDFIQAAPDRTIAESTERIVTLLDGTTTNTPEREIIAILSNTSPVEFRDIISSLANQRSGSNSYLERLYDDLHGDEFSLYLAISNAKLVAARAGTPANLPNTVSALESGTGSSGAHRVYAPSRLFSPGTWGLRSFPENARYRADGSVTLGWRTMQGLTVTGTVERINLDPTELLTVEDRETRAISILTAPEVKYFSDHHLQEANFSKLTIITIAAGGVGVAAAATNTARAGILTFNVLLPAVGQYISENTAAIMAMEGGPEFLAAWRVFNIALAAYGIAQLANSGRRLFADLSNRADNLASRNPASPISTGVRDQVADVISLNQHPRFTPAGQTPAGSAASASAQGPRISGNTALAPQPRSSPFQAPATELPDNVIQLPIRPTPQRGPVVPSAARRRPRRQATPGALATASAAARAAQTDDSDDSNRVPTMRSQIQRGNDHLGSQSVVAQVPDRGVTALEFESVAMLGALRDYRNRRNANERPFGVEDNETHIIGAFARQSQRIRNHIVPSGVTQGGDINSLREEFTDVSTRRTIRVDVENNFGHNLRFIQ